MSRPARALSTPARTSNSMNSWATVPWAKIANCGRRISVPSDRGETVGKSATASSPTSAPCETAAGGILVLAASREDGLDLRAQRAKAAVLLHLCELDGELEELHTLFGVPVDIGERLRAGQQMQIRELVFEHHVLRLTSQQVVDPELRRSRMRRGLRDAHIEVADERRIGRDRPAEREALLRKLRRAVAAAVIGEDVELAALQLDFVAASAEVADLTAEPADVIDRPRRAPELGTAEMLEDHPLRARHDPSAETGPQQVGKAVRDRVAGEPSAVRDAGHPCLDLDRRPARRCQPRIADVRRPRRPQHRLER